MRLARRIRIGPNETCGLQCNETPRAGEVSFLEQTEYTLRPRQSRRPPQVDVDPFLSPCSSDGGLYPNTQDWYKGQVTRQRQGSASGKSQQMNDDR